MRTRQNRAPWHDATRHVPTIIGATDASPQAWGGLVRRPFGTVSLSRAAADFSTERYNAHINVKVAVNAIVPRSPFFSICTSKPTLFTHIKKMRSNISVNEMALFGPLAAFVKGKKFYDSHGEKGGLPTRRDSGPTRYGCAPH